MRERGPVAAGIPIAGPVAGKVVGLIGVTVAARPRRPPLHLDRHRRPRAGVPTQGRRHARPAAPGPKCCGEARPVVTMAFTRPTGLAPYAGHGRVGRPVAGPAVQARRGMAALALRAAGRGKRHRPVAAFRRKAPPPRRRPPVGIARPPRGHVPARRVGPPVGAKGAPPRRQVRLRPPKVKEALPLAPPSMGRTEVRAPRATWTGLARAIAAAGRMRAASTGGAASKAHGAPMGPRPAALKVPGGPVGVALTPWEAPAV